jgi:hypothetical protein
MPITIPYPGGKGRLARFIISQIPKQGRAYIEPFDGLWKGRGIRLIEGKSVRITTDPQEERTDLGEYWKKFGYPKLQAEIAYRVLQKQ